MYSMTSIFYIAMCSTANITFTLMHFITNRAAVKYFQ